MAKNTSMSGFPTEKAFMSNEMQGNKLQTIIFVRHRRLFGQTRPQFREKPDMDAFLTSQNSLSSKTSDTDAFLAKQAALPQTPYP